MNWEEFLFKNLGQMNPRLVAWIEKRLRKVPSISRKIEKEYDDMLADLESSVKPYKNKFPAFTQLPEIGRDRAEILREMEALRAHEEGAWKDGFVSGAVYHGDQEHIDFLNRVYALNSQSNPLHADVWPSATKFEAEIVAMTAHMLNGDGQDVCGTVSSGGTESILLAMKTYRDWAHETKGITKPEMIVPVTAHAAFDKASQYFGIKTIHVPVDSDFRADVDTARKAVSRNTVVIAGSAPSFPRSHTERSIRSRNYPNWRVSMELDSTRMPVSADLSCRGRNASVIPSRNLISVCRASLPSRWIRTNTATPPRGPR
jgi:hypothetical protein